MAIELKSTYIGPNLYLPVPAIRWRFTEQGSRDWQSAESALAFVEPLAATLPNLRARLEQSIPTERLRAPVGSADGPAPTDILAQIVLALQALVGYRVHRSTLVPVGENAVDIVCEMKEAPLGAVAMETAGALMSALTSAGARREEAVADAMHRFYAGVNRQCLDPSTRLIVQAAEARGIPWFRLQSLRIVQLGLGRFSRRISGSAPDSESWIAGGQIARSRSAVLALLSRIELPVPPFLGVASAEAAVAAARHLGYPVTLAPDDTSLRPVGLALGDEEALRQAFAERVTPGQATVLERLVPGDLHRLLMVDGRLVAAARLRSDGAGPEDVTERVHPDIGSLAALAAETIGLTVAGIDYVTHNIALSRREAGALTAVTACPNLMIHRRAEGGQARDVTGPILDVMFPPGTPHHLPVAAVTGTNGKTTTSTMLSRMLRRAGHHVGLVTTIGAWVDDEQIWKGDIAGAKGFQMVAHNPRVDAVVAETARGSLIRRGLGFHNCDVGGVLNVTTDHLGEFGVQTHEDMARVKEIVAQAVTGTLVLNADDPLCLAMAERARAEHVCLVTLEDACPALDNHLAAGGLGARLRQDSSAETLVLCGPQGEEAIITVAEMPAAFGGLARHNLQNALFAASLARGMGVPLPAIREALAQFHCDRQTVPGRLNVYEGHPFKVIVDYGHNPGGYRMVGQMVTAMAEREGGKGRRICVFTSPGDRNDAHLVEIAEAAAPYFDYFICRQSQRDGGGPGQGPEKLRDALIANGVPGDRIATGGNPAESLLRGLNMAKPDDILYVMSTPKPDGGLWEIIEAFGKDDAEQRKAT